MTSHTMHSPPPAMVIAALATTGIVVSMMQTLMVPLLSTLPELLDTSRTNASWAITSTLLAGAVTTPIAGRLGDMYGKRRILLGCMMLVVIGSVVCAVSSGVIPVVAGRSLQGMGIGVIPLGISILRDVLPSERVGFAVAVMSATMGVGGAVCLPIAALVAETFDWHFLFWSCAVLAAAAACAIYLIVPESTVRSGGRVDGVGAIGLTIVLISVLLVITQGNEWGWTSPRVIALACVALAVTPIWGWWQLRARQPLVDLRISASRPVLLTNLASLATGFAMYCQALTLPQLLQSPTSTGYGLGLSMVAAGLCLAPGGLVMMALSPVSARITNTSGPRTALMTGLAVIFVGYLVGIIAMRHAWQIIAISVIIAGGVGIAYASMPALIMKSVPNSETAAANGLNSLMRASGTSLASAVAGAILANLTMSVGAVRFPTEGAFRWTFIIGAAAAAIAFALATCIPRTTAPPRTHEAAESVSAAASPAGSTIHAE